MKYELELDYPDRYPYNKDAIGIEVVGDYDKFSKEWESITPSQAKAVAYVVNYLMKRFNLSTSDIYPLEKI